MRQEERFLIQDGSVRLGLRGSRAFAAGEEAVIPPGTAHTFKVEGGSARFVAEFRPPWRIGEFFQELFALSTEGWVDKRGNPKLTDLAVLMRGLLLSARGAAGAAAVPRAAAGAAGSAEGNGNSRDG